MSTYSVYNIKIDNELSFTPGAATGSVLAINAEGITYWGSPSTGPTGPTGAAGTNGTNGATGATGATGPAPTDSKTFQTLTDAATISWTYSNGYNAKVTLVGTNRSLSITGATNGNYGTLIVTQGPTGAGNRINFGASDKFPSATYSFSTTGTQSDIFTFVYDGTNFYWNYNKNFS